MDQSIYRAGGGFIEALMRMLEGQYILRIRVPSQYYSLVEQQAQSMCLESRQLFWNLGTCSEVENRCWYDVVATISSHTLILQLFTSPHDSTTSSSKSRPTEYQPRTSVPSKIHRPLSRIQQDGLARFPITSSGCNHHPSVLPPRAPPPTMANHQSPPAQQHPRKPHPHPYLSGNFAPIERTLPLTPCPHTGTIPTALRGGQYVRNGGNPVTNADLGRDAHWFDGDGMLAGVLFGDDNSGGDLQAQFVNQFMLTDVYVSSLGSTHLQRPILPSIAALVDPVTSLLKIMWIVFRTIFLVLLSRLPGSEIAIRKISVANTAVVWHDGRALATCESGPPLRFVLPTLQTVGWFLGDRAEGEPPVGEKSRGEKQKEEKEVPVQDVGRGSQFGWAGPVGFMREWTTAHPRVDPVTQELLAFHSTFVPPYINYSIVPTTGRYGPDDTTTNTSSSSSPASASPKKRLMNAVVPGVSAARMMHDFGVSRQHTIIMDLPLSLDPTNSLRGKPVVEYDANGTSRFGVFPRWHPEQIRWFETRACSIFHTANSWEGSALVDEGRRTVATVEMLACRLTSASLVFSAGDIAAPAVKVAPKYPEEDQCRLYYYSFDMSASSPPPTTSTTATTTTTTPQPRNRILSQYALTAIPFEFPSVRESAAMQPARYVYGCSMTGTGNFTAALGRATKIDVLAKIDVQALIVRGRAEPPEDVVGAVDVRGVDEVHAAAEERRRREWEGGEEEKGRGRDPIQLFVMPKGWYCQEPRFVPRQPTPSTPPSSPFNPSGADDDEDDGYLLTYAFDESQLHPSTGEAPSTSASELWIIDAKTMNTVLARVKLPQRVPYGLHGAWFSKGMVEGQRGVVRVRELPEKVLRERKGESREEGEARWRRERLEESLGGMLWGWVRAGVEKALG